MKKNTYIYYIYDKVLMLLPIIVGISWAAESKSKEITILMVILLVVYFILDYINDDFRVIWFLMDLKKGKIIREATYEKSVNVSTFEGNMWCGAERHPQIYSEIRFREKELNGIYYVFAEDRKLFRSLGYPEGPVYIGDRVQITYFEKSKLVVSVKKIE